MRIRMILNCHHDILLAGCGPHVAGHCKYPVQSPCLDVHPPGQRVVAEPTAHGAVETGQREPVTIDDACMFLAEFENGSLGTFESTRYARGRR